MSDPLGYVKALASRARQEEAPQGRVSEGVLRRLKQLDAPSERPLLAFAVASATLSVAAVVFSLWLVPSSPDALVYFYRMTDILAPWQWS